VSQRPPSRRGFVDLLEVTAAHCLRSVSYPRLCTKSRRRPATLGFSLRSSAYLCDLCVKRALQTQRSQRYAEGRREIFDFLCKAVHHLKKQAPSAHVSRFGLCTNGVQYGVEQAGATLSQRGVRLLATRCQRRASAAYCVMWISSSLLTWPKKYIRPQINAIAARPSAIHPEV
jgi:hypothetical protein